MADQKMAQDRVAGVLVGMACGDALGARYEFGPPLSQDASVAMIGGGSLGWQPGEWTDDTSMAIAIAEATEHGADLREAATQDAIVRRWVQWAETANDIGNQTRQVLSSAADTGTAEAASAAAKALHKRTGRSGGNGSLMRTAPIALAYLHDPDALVQAARAISSLTHYDRHAGDACVLWCLAIRHAVLHAQFELRAGLEALPEQRRRFWVERITEAEAGRPRDFDRNGWVVQALQGAWSAIINTPVPQENSAAGTYRADHFRLALESAVRGGHDTDTVAAIAGALLGACWGVSAVPTEWQRVLHGWPGLRQRDLVKLAITVASGGVAPTPRDYDYLDTHRTATVHPDDAGILIGPINAAPELPAQVDAVVSLCPVSEKYFPSGAVRAEDRIEIWLIDSVDEPANPNLDFVLDQATQAVLQLRAEGKTVYLHCAAGQSRTPLVAALVGARISGCSPAEAFARVVEVLPETRLNARFAKLVAQLSGPADVSAGDEPDPETGWSASDRAGLEQEMTAQNATEIFVDDQFQGSGGTVRIPAESGVLIMLETALIIRRHPDHEELTLGVDIIIDDPWRGVRYRNRPITAGDFASLYHFLHAAMSDVHPELSVPALQCESAGLVMSINGSDDLTVELDLQVTQYQSDKEPDLDHVSVSVARAALWEAADIAKAIAQTFGYDPDLATGGE